MPDHDSDYGCDRFPIDRRTVLSVGAGATTAAFGIGAFAGTASAWKRFDVDFKGRSIVWMIVGDDLDYDPPAIAHVIVSSGLDVECRLVEFTAENATTAPEHYGDDPVVKYHADDGIVLGVLPYNRPGAGAGRFGRPRCVMENEYLQTDEGDTSRFRGVECVETARQDHWDGDVRACWFDPLDSREPAQQLQGFGPDDPSDGQEFGAHVAIDQGGDVVLVGAPGDDENGAHAGAAYVFSSRNGQWRQDAKLLPENGGTAGDEFGRAVDLSDDGSIAMVGAPSAGDAGATAVFTAGSTDWNQTDRLRPDDAVTDAHFGQSVALDGAGEYALIGSDDGIYGVTNGSDWVVEHHPEIPESDLAVAQGGTWGKRWGRIATLDDGAQTALVADPRAGGYGFGEAHCLTRGQNGWSHASLIGVGADSDHYGAALALDADGDIAIVGTNPPPIAAIPTGFAQVVSKGPGSSTNRPMTIQPADGAGNDRFGRSVAVDDDGTLALIGAPLHDTAQGTDAGAAYLFADDGAGWIRVGKYIAADGAAADQFGEAVALDSAGESGVVGAPFADADGVESGRVSVVDIE